MKIRRKGEVSTASPFRSFDELLVNVPSEPDWLWRELVAPESLTLLAGKPKVGKSTVVYGLLGALVAGRPFVGRATRTTRALVLSEEPPVATGMKIDKFGGRNAHHSIHRADLRAFGSWAESIDAAASHAHANGLGLIVVDTFAELAGIRGDEENDAGSILGAIDPLRKAADGGLAVLLVHHQRKSGGTHGDGIRGSGALVGAVDVLLELERGGGSQSTRVLKHESRYLPEGRFYVELSDAGYTAKGTSDIAERGLVEATLNKRGAASAEELVTATDLSRTKVDRYLGQLGAVVIRGTGKRGDPQIHALPGAAFLSSSPEP